MIINLSSLLCIKRLFLLFTILICGCSKHYEICDDAPSFSVTATKLFFNKTKERDLSKAIYHLSTGTWITPQKDPYDLDCIIEACKILGISPGDIPITVTHYAVKIFPKNEKEQWSIELAEGVNVDYTPFNYEPVTYEQNKELGPEPKNKEKIQDDCRYTVTYESVLEGGSSVVENYRIPVLYSIWPIEKPLPEGIEYEIDHNVFIPDYDKGGYDESDKVLLKSIEREAIYLALGFYPTDLSDSNRSNDVITLMGYVYHYDSLCDSLIGQHNLKIRFQLGSNIWNTYVQPNGAFSITDAISTAASYRHVFQHPKWKLTNDNSTSPLQINWGDVSDWWSSINDTPIMSPSSSDVRYSVLPAVNYYYYGTHSIRTWYYDEGIRIIIPGVVGSNASEFYFTDSPTYIKVYENNHNSIGLLFGDVTHELGHFTMYCECGGYNDYMTNYYAIDKLLRESYACYVGWYLTKTRYATLGYTESPPNDFTGEAMQHWSRTKYDVSTYGIYIYYSPMFVDLVDTYNQSTPGYYYNYDDYSITTNVHLRIREMAAQCKTWEDIKDYLEDYVGISLTQSQFNNFCFPYNYWYEHI